jgi:hypothetical protein
MSNPIYSLDRRCATCKHWQGDKEKAVAMFEEDPLSMDLSKGWPDDGACGIDYEFLNTEINGDATVTNGFDANFGCVYWCA